MLKIGEITWNQRQVLDGGAGGLVYRVAAGVVAKVGEVETGEVAAQRYFAEQGLALPVWDYAPRVEVPNTLLTELCPLHGLRASILGTSEEEDCTCDQRTVAVLLMPEAEELDAELLRSPEVQTFIATIEGKCLAQFGFPWDSKPANLGYFQGNLIALDFGVP